MRPDVDSRVIDRLRRLGGKELLSEMIDLFTSHAELAIRDASSAWAQHNLDAIRRAAHSLKSSAGNLGATEVRILADEIEQLAEHGANDFQPLLSDLEKAYIRAKERLAEVRDKETQGLENSGR